METVNTILKFDTNRKAVKVCPCGRNNRDGKFSPFKGYNDKGYCHSCDKTFFPDPHPDAVRSFSSPKGKEQTNTQIDFLPFDVFEKSVMAHEKCNLFPFLEKLFRKPLAKWLCENYFIGANKNGDTVFWQVDISGNIRQAKVMEYNSSTGRRNKDTGALCAGKKILGNKDANLCQCFFGEYLLYNNNNPLAIVESEKTAVIASVYYPQFTWIATGGKNGCSLTEFETTKIFRGKRVILFPDANAYDPWNEKAKLMEKVSGCKVAVSDLLEKNATNEDKEKGLDIVDYLLRDSDETGLALIESYPVMWDYTS